MKSSDQTDRLERLISNTLRGQPLRRAPGTLESRVLAAIEQRATQPWWRKDFARWPLTARALFLFLSAGFVKLAVDGTMWLIEALDARSFVTQAASQLAWMKTVVVALITVVQDIPSGWISLAIVVLGAMYAALFGIGAAAYRTLYVSR